MSLLPSSSVPPLIGHRGAAGHAPENTLASIAEAARLGARWVEFDVKLTRDSRLILFHDDTLERTTNGTGQVAERTLAELRALDAGSWYQRKFAGETIPTIEEAMAALARLGLGANVEIKPCPGRDADTGRATAEMLKARWPETLPAPLLSSFSPEALAAAAAVAPEFPRAVLFGTIPDDWRRRAETVGATAVHCDRRRLARDQAGVILGAGFALRCFTVNEGATAAALFSWGVESVFTDYPDRIRSL